MTLENGRKITLESHNPKGLRWAMEKIIFIKMK